MFRANIYGPLYGELLYYTFAAGRLHTKKLCSRLYSIEIGFRVRTKALFSHPLVELGVTYALHL